MAKIALLCPPARGHLYPFFSLAAALKGLGHEPVFFQVLDCHELVLQAGFSNHPVGQEQFSRGALETRLKHIGQAHGVRAVARTMKVQQALVEVHLRELPALLQNLGIEFLVSDHFQWEGLALAEQAGLPAVTVSNAVSLWADDQSPPVFFSGPYARSAWDRFLNRAAHAVNDFFFTRFLAPLNRFRKEHGLVPIRGINDTYSRLAHFSQVPEFLDFPRSTVPPFFHFPGPLVKEENRRNDPTPDLPATRPIIYASLGTLHHQHVRVFRLIAQACARFDVHLVISLAGAPIPAGLADLPGRTLVVQSLVPSQILAKACLCITHGGANTVLETLRAGVPLLVLPFANDQPGMASRVVHHGLGLQCPGARVTHRRLVKLLQTLLTTEAFKKRAGAVAEQLSTRDGAVATARHISSLLARSD